MSRGQLSLFLVVNLSQHTVTLEHTYTEAMAAVSAIKGIPDHVMPGHITDMCKTKITPVDPIGSTRYGETNEWTVPWEGEKFKLEVTELWGVSIDITSLVRERAFRL